MRLFHSVMLLLALCAVCLPLAALASAPTTADSAAVAANHGELHVVACSHLDTQWRWTIQQTIAEYLPATLHENFALFEKYPDYVFSFEGAFRYQLIKEYYPEEYERMKQYIRAGRWRVVGSWLDAVDTNIPSPESLIRHALYGNGFFRREFGVTSRDVFLPDCFGFGFALPSVATHCGLLGFSTQKLSWGSSVGIPFDIGLWEGVDGSTLVAALNPSAYVSRIGSDLSADSTWVATVARQGAESGLYAGYK
ncbi:MAG: alpha-mannosidase, partial [bacterium]